MKEEGKTEKREVEKAGKGLSRKRSHERFDGTELNETAHPEKKNFLEETQE